MKWNLQAMEARADKVIQLKAHLKSTFPSMETEVADRIVFMAGFTDAFKEGMKAAEQPSQGYSPDDMMIFAKFAKDYKSSPDVKKALAAFVKDYPTIVKKYKP